MILAAVLAIQLSSMIAMIGPNENTSAYNVYAKYSNNQEQTQSLYNDCQAGDLSGAPNCANNGLQAQTDGGTNTITNTQGSNTDINYRSIGDRNIGLQNTGDTSSGDVNSDNDGDVEGGNGASSGDANGGNFLEGDFNCDGCNTADTESSLSAQEIASTGGTLAEMDQLQEAGENPREQDQGINSESSNLEDPFILPFS
jgi:hypothetical protein